MKGRNIGCVNVEEEVIPATELAAERILLL